MEERPRQFVQNIPAARQLRRPQTPTEGLLWELLRDRRLDGLKFRRQHAVGRFDVDFYCYELRLAVEIDGGIHSLPDHRAADLARHVELEAAGLWFVRIAAEVIETNVGRAVEQLRHAISIQRSSN